MINRNFKYDPKKYEYSRDGTGKIRRAEKTQDKSVIRFKFLEGIYRWWRARSLDTRFSLIPIGFAFLATFIIYNTSVFFYERSERATLRAQIPEEYSDKKKFERYKSQNPKLEEFKKQYKEKLTDNKL